MEVSRDVVVTVTSLLPLHQSIFSFPSAQSRHLSSLPVNCCQVQDSCKFSTLMMMMMMMLRDHRRQYHHHHLQHHRHLSRNFHSFKRFPRMFFSILPECNSDKKEKNRFRFLDENNLKCHTSTLSEHLCLCKYIAADNVIFKQ